MKKIIKANNTELGPWTSTDVIEGRARTIYTVETKRAYYRSNSLDSVMKLWQKMNDNSEVLDVSRLG